MKPGVLLLFALCIFLTSNAWGQAGNFEDGFEDGNFTTNPSWIGDTNDFKVVQDNPNFLLQLDADDTSPSYLATPSSQIDGFWQFYIAFRGFEPSGSNQAEIFLMSNIANLEGPMNGYAVQVGQSGDDIFKIVRYDNGSEAATVVSDTTVIDSGAGYTVKVARDNSGNWQIAVAKGYGKPLFNSGNTGTDITHTSSSYFGTKVNFTSSRSDKFFFDFNIDRPPFTLTNATANANQVEVTFNRAYAQASVGTSDFSIDNGMGSPNAIDFISDITVQLTYSRELSSNRYSLTTQNISDQHGDIIDNNTTNEFIVFGSYTNGDIIINEFMYNPPGNLEEYIELKNTGSKYLDLSSWQIGDNSELNALGSTPTIIEPESFIVISSDTSALNTVFGPGIYYQLNNMATLNNGGDAVRLLTETGTLADSLTYTPEWGGEDVALERRSDTAPSTLKENFGNSPNPLDGTPGSSNEIAPDNTSPTLTNLQFIDSSTLELIFSETLAPQTTTDADNYSISPHHSIQLISAMDDTVMLFLSLPLQTGQNYQIGIKNIQDLFGNTITETIQEDTYTEISEARSGEVVINEILYTRKNAGDPEFVELFNTTTKNFDLSNWTLSDARNTSLFDAGTQLTAGGYLVITDDITLANRVDNGLYLTDFPSLNDNGDAVCIQDGFGTRIDSLFYSSAYGGQDKSTSAERKDPKAASNDPSNFSSSTVSRGSTPGIQNSVFERDETPPELLFSRFTASGDIEVRFSEFIKRTSNLSFSINGQTLTAHSFNPDDGDHIFLYEPSGISNGSELNITAQNLTDIKGNTTNSSHIAIAQKLSSEDVVINEIMYNPLNDSDDNQPDQSEYLELRNTRNYAISLEGITLHDEPDENDEVRSLIPVSTRSKWIPAQGTALVYADEVRTFKESQTARFFGIREFDSFSLIQMDRSSLSLASSGDAIYLADSTGANIDSVFYDESWQNPNIIDARGIALERISPTGESNSNNNWGSSVHPKGGTPGSENSLFQQETDSPIETGISFSPNPFSPDNDGYEDNLFINYTLDQPDYLLKVRIYDRYGRLIKKLADGKQAGFKGTLIWDGHKNNGGRNRIGIYIVVFEAFDSESGRDRAFKKTVVLARKLH